MPLSIPKAETRNRLIRLMSEADHALLAPHMSRQRVSKCQVLLDRDQSADLVWFPESGVSSLITISPAGLSAENGLFGRDGFVPVPLVLGSNRGPQRAVVQVAGECQTVPVPEFLRAIAASPDLHHLLLRYTQTLRIQTAFTALSNAVHHIDERLARWLLMTHDRLDGTELPLTHEFLSTVLGVRRPSVTTALHVLEGKGFIRSERGCIIIRDRAALEQFARDSYGVPEAEYERLIGPLR
ncbi:Crp/Fnr family transcriptional regulator [Croceibacterium ferulae]|uniref:Crp/Fnr family transcriptional regulator n=1 Tax=Croceibacterium ferulae TaxID=1854641 RepID=UPI001F4E990C|nr:Crp/Fnr family transcriptional regulator [Croceibacterium ferulae]